MSGQSMLRKVARRFRLRKDERGVSGLLEVTAVLLLMGIVLGALYSSLYSGQNTVLDSSERLRNLDEARTLIAVITKDIRTAVRTEAGTSPFLRADKQEAVFYANLETTAAPKLVRIFVDAQDRLYEQVWDYNVASTTVPQYRYGSPAAAYRATPTTCGTGCTVRLVGHFVANTPTEPLFTYVTDAGTTLATPMSGTDANLLSIKAVEVELRVKRDTRFNVNTTVIQNKVRLPNLEYNAVAG